MSLPQQVKSAEIPKLKDSSLLKNKGFINNEWVGSKSGETFAVYDPATGESIGELPDMTQDDVKTAIQVATDAFESWSETTSKVRHDLLKKWQDSITENVDDLAIILVRENGKPFEEAKGEVMATASYLEWFAEEAVRMYGATIPSPISSQRTLTIKQAVGPVSLITPWNFPSAMIGRKVSAALAAGCTVVIKPSDETPYSCLALCELAKRVGIPAGVINVVLAQKNTKDVGTELSTNSDIRKVSFTGSTETGKLLFSQAAGTIKKVSMELGGNAPFIVFDDADLESAVKTCFDAKFKSNGEVCIAANRIYIQKGLYEKFTEKLTEMVSSKLSLGSGFNKEVTTGPLIDKQGAEKVEKLIKNAVDNGAKIKVGGKRIEDTNFVEPTVLANMKDNMDITHEEIFGPVAALYSFNDEKEVIKKANNTNMGLASYFFARDLSRVWRVAEKLQTGMVGVNTCSIENPSAPFGGVKESGIGKEGSYLGMEDYVNYKTIHLGLD